MNIKCPWAGGVEFLCWPYPMSGEETGRGRSSAEASEGYPLAVIPGLVPVMIGAAKPATTPVAPLAPLPRFFTTVQPHVR